MIHCFYHSVDLDGHCSGAIVKFRFPDAVMHPINYGDEFPWDEIGQDDEVYMVDFALQPFGGMASLNAFCKLHWIDHHKSAIDSACDVWLNTSDSPRGIRDATRAACELTWEYLFPDKPVPLAVKLLSLYDSWRYQGHELEDMVLPFQIRLRMEELDPKNWGGCKDRWCLLFGDDPYLRDQSEWLRNRYQKSNINKMIEEGRLLLRHDEANKAKYAKTYAFDTILHLLSHQVIKPRKYSAIAVNLGHTNSKVFDTLWDESKYDLMITFVRRTDKMWNVSLYSTKNDIDCGFIAKSFGGGGHKGAAGFQCKELPFEY